MQAKIVTLPGDYIGPEIMAEAVKVLTAVGKSTAIPFSLMSAGWAARPSTHTACR